MTVLFMILNYSCFKNFVVFIAWTDDEYHIE